MTVTKKRKKKSSRNIQKLILRSLNSIHKYTTSSLKLIEYTCLFFILLSTRFNKSKTYWVRFTNSQTVAAFAMAVCNSLGNSHAICYGHCKLQPARTFTQENTSHNLEQSQLVPTSGHWMRQSLQSFHFYVTFEDDWIISILNYHQIIKWFLKLCEY